MKGAISEGGVPTILREAYLHRLTGVLNFTRPGAHRMVRFVKGCIVGADADTIERSLGQELVREALVTPEDLKRARAMMAASGASLGKVLQALNLIDRSRFEDVAALHAREILLEVFAWDEGTFRFEEKPVEAVEDGDTTLKLSTGEIILEAVRTGGSSAATRRALGNMNRLLIPSTDPVFRFQRITLTPIDGFVLSRVDGTLSALQIVEIASLPADEVERSLFALLCVGMIEYLPVIQVAEPSPILTKRDEKTEALRRQIMEAYSALRSRSHFEVLGVPETSSASEIKAAYFRLAKTFHPDAHHEPALADLRDQLDATFTRINTAFDVLSNPERRASYESYLARQRGQDSPALAAKEPEIAPAVLDKTLQDAEQLHGEGKHWELIGLLSGVLPHARGRLRQRMLLLRAQAYMKSSEGVRKAIEDLQAVLTEDAGHAQANYLLGMAFIGAGLKKRAAGHFRKALELRPQYREARMELERIGEDDKE